MPMILTVALLSTIEVKLSSAFGQLVIELLTIIAKSAKSSLMSYKPEIVMRIPE